MRRILMVAVMLCLLIPSKSSAEKKWQEHKGQHFIIYYKNAPQEFVENVEKMGEFYYTQIAENLGFTRYEGWTWDNRAKIYIYDSAEDYQAAGRGAAWSNGEASPKSRTIRTFPTAHGFFDSTLPHELGHIIFHEFIGFKAQVPVWFEEGIAMCQEEARRWGADDAVRQIIKDDKFLSLDEMTLMGLSGRMSAEHAQVIYAESASVMNYLLKEWGQMRFVRLCRKLKEGGPFEWAFSSVYVHFKSVAKLNKAWVDYLEGN